MNVRRLRPFPPCWRRPAGGSISEVLQI